MHFSLLGTDFWIGLDDNEQQSDFRWLNGAPLCFVRFPNTEPNGKSVENCNTLIPHSPAIADNQCSRLDQAICSSVGVYTSHCVFRELSTLTILSIFCFNFGRISGVFVSY